MAEHDSAAVAPEPVGPVDVPWELNVPVADLYLVGYGMRLPNDLTLEALAVLRRCARVFGAPPINAQAFGIPPMESLLPLYGVDKRRLETYAEMEALVLDAAQTEPPVAFATYGSAMVGTYVGHRLLQEAPRRGLTVHVANAVSSFDGIWADFNIEPFFGFQIWEATAFVQLAVTPDTQAHLLLPQAPVFGVTTGIDPSSQTLPSIPSTSALAAHLMRFYPGDHEVHFVRTSMNKAGAAGPRGTIVDTVRLRSLDGARAAASSTLLVPRLRRNPDPRLQQDFAASAVVARRPADDDREAEPSARAR